MNDVTIYKVKKMFTCIKSLQKAINKAGGGSAENIETEIETMSALDLIALIAPNNIEFIFRKPE